MTTHLLDPPRPMPAEPAPPEAAEHAVHLRALLGAETVQEYRHALAEGVERVAERIAGVDRPATGASPERLRAELAAVDLDRPVRDTAAALDELGRLWLRDAVWFHHPRYLAHLNCPVAIPALLGEAMLSAVNTSLDTWDQSAGATLVEQRLVAWTAARIGLGENADGVFTSGGTQSNLQALLLARDETLARDGGAYGPDRLRVVTSAAAHFSVAKAAAVLGLGRDAVVALPADADRRLCPDAVAAELDRCRAAGLVPMAVVATAGTTDFGSIDPLPALAAVCRDRQVWLHADAAYGCGLLVSRRRAHLLAGLELADSVTVDYHKAFFQPVSSSAVLVRDRATLRHATYHADYLNPADAGVPNLVDKSLQTTRRFDALKLWLTLRILGPDTVGALFDAVVDLAGQVWQLLDADPRFEVVNRPQLSTLVFRYVPPGGAGPQWCDAANAYARAALPASGQAVVAGTRVDGRQYLKLTLLNPRTSVRDVAEVLDLVAAHADDHLSGKAG